MSPIRIEIAPQGGEAAGPRIESTVVQPGMAVSSIDHGPHGDTVLAIMCDPLDTGGRVMRQFSDDSDLSIDHTHRRVNPRHGEIIKIVGKNDTAEVEMTTRLGSITLYLTHFTPDNERNLPLLPNN